MLNLKAQTVYEVVDKKIPGWYLYNYFKEEKIDKALIVYFTSEREGFRIESPDKLEEWVNVVDERWLPIKGFIAQFKS